MRAIYLVLTAYFPLIFVLYQHMYFIVLKCVVKDNSGNSLNKHFYEAPTSYPLLKNNVSSDDLPL